MLPFYAPAMAGLVMLVLAAWLLWLSSERRQARAFALLLVFRGLSLVALTLGPTTADVDLMILAAILYPLFCLATVTAVVYFVAVYPAPRSWLPPGALGPALFFGPLAVIMGWALLQPNLVTPLPFPSETGPQAMLDWIMGSTRAPLGVAPTLLDLTLIAPALLLVRDYLRSSVGRARSTLLLVGFGFFLPAACSCLVAGALLQLRPGMPRPADPSVFNIVEMGIFALWFTVMIALLGYLGVRAWRDPNPANRRAAGMFGALVIVSTAIGASTSLFRDPIDAGASIFVMVAFWSLLGAILVTIGVVRHSLFDIDLRVRRTLERGTIAAVFVVAYFVVTESATELFADFSGSAYVGIGAAALLLFALHPLERLAGAVVGGAMPRTKPLADLDQSGQVAFYREQLELMWMDGVLSAKDRMVLTNLRGRLGLQAEIAERIELEVLQGSGGAAPGSSG